MTVNDFRQTLGRLIELLRTSEAKAGKLNDLNEFAAALAPYDEMTLKAFVKLVEQGHKPIPPAGPRPRPAKDVDAEAVVAELKDIYERAGGPSVTEQQVHAACGKLKGLKKDDLVRLADGIELVGMRGKTVGAIRDGITARLVDRKNAAIRRGLIDRPTSAEPVTTFSD